MEREVVVRGVDGGALRNEISVGPHRLASENGDAEPRPFELLLGALGACTSMTVKSYADRKGWPVTGLEIRLTRDPEKGIRRTIRIDGDLDAEQRKRLLEIADRCPVHRALVGGVPVHTEPA
jgi:putative redox protein